jgi:plastocyanin
MHRRHVAHAALAVLVAVGGATACGGDGDAAAAVDEAGGGGGLSSSGDDGSAPHGEVPDDLVVMDGAEVAVTSLDNTFRAENIQVAPGATVVWTNKGRNDHDVLPVEGDDWGAEVDDFKPGDVYEHTFDGPGVYSYYCSIHGTTTAGMVGTVVVAE